MRCQLAIEYLNDLFNVKKYDACTVCDINFLVYLSNFLVYLRGRTASALAWHSDGRAHIDSMVAPSLPSGCSKSCDLWPAFAPCSTWSSEGTALCRVGVTDSQLDLPSLTPLFEAGCG